MESPTLVPSPFLSMARRGCAAMLYCCQVGPLAAAAPPDIASQVCTTKQLYTGITHHSSMFFPCFIFHHFSAPSSIISSAFHIKFFLATSLGVQRVDCWDELCLGWTISTHHTWRLPTRPGSTRKTASWWTSLENGNRTYQDISRYIKVVAWPVMSNLWFLEKNGKHSNNFPLSDLGINFQQGIVLPSIQL